MENALIPNSSAIEPKILQIEALSGLHVSWIKTSAELTRALQGGLSELYQEVFADPPYNEKFTDGEVTDVFSEILDNNGLIFTAAQQAGAKPIAFVASIPLISQPALIEAVSGTVNNPVSTSYFAEDGTQRDFRHRGISTHMKDLLLYANGVSGFSDVLLRTSMFNYRQISAVYKAGGKPVPGAFQDVTSVREDGSVSSDRRCFFLFNGNALSGQEPIWTIPRVVVARPGGNDTAIVFSSVARDLQAPVSLQIQEAFPGVEQVMFVEPATEHQDTAIRGQMAGGEFCGNATRSLGFVQLNGKDGAIDLEISGAEKPLRVDVRNNFAKTEIPILSDLNCLSKNSRNGEYIVNLQGISFLVTWNNLEHGSALAREPNLEKRKERVLGILKDHNIADKPASGVLVLTADADGELSLDPYVYVRDTGTIYYESGCGSGSTAVGLVLSSISGKSIIDQKITQPSGMGLYVSVNRTENAFAGASVSGPIEVLFDGRMYMPQKLSAPAPGH